MKKKKYGTNKSLSWGIMVIYLILIVGICGAISFLFINTNGFTDDFKTFFLEINGEKITYNKDIRLARDTDLVISAKYLMNSSSEANGFKITVVPSGLGDKFEFTVGDEKHLFSNAKKCDKYFIKSQTDTSVTINAGKWDMQEILNTVYGTVVTIIDYEPSGSVPMFIIRISSYNGKTIYNLPLYAGVPVESIELDKEGIIYG